MRKSGMKLRSSVYTGSPTPFALSKSWCAFSLIILSRGPSTTQIVLEKTFVWDCSNPLALLNVAQTEVILHILTTNLCQQQTLQLVITAYQVMCMDQVCQHGLPAHGKENCNCYITQLDKLSNGGPLQLNPCGPESNGTQ